MFWVKMLTPVCCGTVAAPTPDAGRRRMLIESRKLPALDKPGDWILDPRRSALVLVFILLFLA
jgi:hypothetical protein